MLRRELLARRAALSREQQQQAGQRIYDALATEERFQQAQTIAFYHAINAELDLELLFQEALNQQKTCCLPVMLPGNWLSFMPYKLGDPIAPNQYEILEPIFDPDAVIPPQEIDLLLVPLVGIDDQHCRLGMGGGCFDRTFEYKLFQPKAKPWMIGVGYQFQLIDRLELDEWDVRLDEVVLV